jgi:predicted secreted protein
MSCHVRGGNVESAPCNCVKSTFLVQATVIILILFIIYYLLGPFAKEHMISGSVPVSLDQLLEAKRSGQPLTIQLLVT